MTKTELRAKARERLLLAMQTAFIECERDEEGAEAEAIKELMSEQMARVERMFDYVPYSWGRCC